MSRYILALYNTPLAELFLYIFSLIVSRCKHPFNITMACMTSYMKMDTHLENKPIYIHRTHYFLSYLPIQSYNTIVVTFLT